MLPKLSEKDPTLPQGRTQRSLPSIVAFRRSIRKPDDWTKELEKGLAALDQQPSGAPVLASRLKHATGSWVDPM
jgi:hypothetical protein